MFLDTERDRKSMKSGESITTRKKGNLTMPISRSMRNSDQLNKININHSLNNRSSNITSFAPDKKVPQKDVSMASKTPRPVGSLKHMRPKMPKSEFVRRIIKMRDQ